MQFQQSTQKPGLSSPAHLPDRLGFHVRKRMQATLDRLEREARRMLQLEADLGRFASQYYAAVGNLSERLAQLDQLAMASVAEAKAIPEACAQKEAAETRRQELKLRYRHLAKTVHPDLRGTDRGTSSMHTLNAAYQQGDLAGLLKLEAQMTLERMTEDASTTLQAIDNAVREVAHAADTYANGYLHLLNSPMNELMLRAMQAKRAGWDWVQAVVRKLERAVEEKERALAMHGIGEISAWAEGIQAA